MDSKCKIALLKKAGLGELFAAVKCLTSLYHYKTSQLLICSLLLSKKPSEMGVVGTFTVSSSMCIIDYFRFSGSSVLGENHLPQL